MRFAVKGGVMRRQTRFSRAPVQFKEAVGKTVAFIEQVVIEEDGGWCVEIHFTDRSVLVFNMRAALEIDAQYMKSVKGELKITRQYARPKKRGRA